MDGNGLRYVLYDEEHICKFSFQKLFSRTVDVNVRLVTKYNQDPIAYAMTKQMGLPH